MNNNPFSDRKFLISAIVLVSALILMFYYIENIQSDEYQLDEYSEPHSTDSVSLSGSSKMLKSEFEDQHHASSWFELYHNNKVSFDETYADSTLDIYGTIVSISNSWDCSEIELDASPHQSRTYTISLTNCPQGKDQWKDEVSKVAVGSNIHVRGKYGAAASSEYEMRIYACHIITD